MSWYYEGKEVTELPGDCVGYVYCIENLITQRKYIGKKLAKFAKTSIKTVTQKNGIKKKKRIRTKVDSDWRDYYGSSDALTADIEALGKSCFNREILYYCYSKGECSYLEMYEQIKRGVLESDEYYNGIINVRIGSSKILREALLKLRTQGKLL